MYNFTSTIILNMVFMFGNMQYLDTKQCECNNGAKRCNGNKGVIMFNVTCYDKFGLLSVIDNISVVKCNHKDLGFVHVPPGGVSISCNTIIRDTYKFIISSCSIGRVDGVIIC